jgi:cytochrome c oxidase subunit 2
MSNKLLGKLAALATALAGFATSANAAWEVNMPRGVTAVSNEVYGLHMLIFWVCVAIAVVVFGAMIVSLVKHRKSVGVEPAKFTHSTKAEIIWTIIPIAILVAMAVPAADTLIRMEDTRGSDITIKATGYQWKWRYDYIDEGFGFYSSLHPEHNRARQLNSGIDVSTIDNYLLEVDNPLVVPLGAKVRLLLTSSDVIHAWWVPDFGGKRDAIPGFVNEFWFKPEAPGVYRGQCAELCGRDHGFMPIVVHVLEEDDYRAWIAEQTADLRVEPAVMRAAVAQEVAVQPAADVQPAGGQPVEWSMDTAMSLGEQTYGVSCAACHQLNGQGMPPAFPAIAGSAVVMGGLAAHIDIIVNGKPGTAMAAFGAQLDDEALAAVITYQRNAFGNGTGDLVTPDQIAAAR